VGHTLARGMRPRTDGAPPSGQEYHFIVSLEESLRSLLCHPWTFLFFSLFFFLSSPKNYNLAPFCCCYLNPSPFLFLIFLPWSFWKIFIGFQFHLSIQIYDFLKNWYTLFLFLFFFLSYFVKVLFVFNVHACISTKNQISFIERKYIPT